MNNSKVSIIVPVFNSEIYLYRTIKSITNQTYKNLEILLVDDGSKDNSGQICDEFEKKDSRIKVFHIKNSGSAEARNIGLKEATGKYVMFVDADDFLEVDGVSLLVTIAEQYNLDIVCGKYNFVDEQGVNLNIYMKSFFKNRECKDVMNGETYLCINGLEPILWRYFYLRKYLLQNNFRLKSFHGNGCYEDTDFVIRAIHKCNRIMYTNIVFYNYVQRKTSQSKIREASLSYNLINVADGLVEYVDKEVKTSLCKDFFQVYIDALYGQAVQRVIQLKCDLKIFDNDIFKNKVANRLLKSKIKRYRIIGFCLKFNLIKFYDKIYYFYRQLFLKYHNLK